MKVLRALLAGFVISFIGSVPLGYLNLVGFSIYSQIGIADLLAFIAGVVLIEALVISSTFYFAAVLSKQQRLQFFLKLFSNFFLIAIGFSLLFSSVETQTTVANPFESFGSFQRGILLSSLNFFQLPFWVAWNIYVVSSKFADTNRDRFSFYLGGTLIGTTVGMLTFIFCLSYLNSAAFTGTFSLKQILGATFLLLGVVQLSILLYKRIIVSK